MTRVVFLGTPAAAVHALQHIARVTDVGLVVTQPDRPKGRSKEPWPSHVKTAANDLQMTVVQPENRNDLLANLRQAAPFDVGIVVAFGQILTHEMLQIPEHGFLNIHFSLLPRWRGAAPVERAIMAGDSMTGATIIKLDEGLDTGPVLTAQAIDLGGDDTGGAVTERLADIGARLLVRTLDSYLDGTLNVVPQVKEGSTYAKKLSPKDRPIQLEEGLSIAERRIRALSPSPGATAVIDGEPFKILAAGPAETTPAVGTWELVDGIPVVGLSDGGLEVSLLQPPGKKVMAGGDWARGIRRSGGVVE